MTPGSYTATVTVTDVGGQTGTDTVQITVTDPPGNRAPSVDFGVAPGSGDAPLSVLFSPEASDPDDDELTYLWEFGDGDTSTQAGQIRHTYRQGGSFTAKLTVSDGELSASKSVTITVGNPPTNQAPTVQIAADPIRGTAPLDVRFTASGRDPEGGPLMYTWDYGDGSAGAGRSVTHRYLTPGTYTAKVTARDAQGASGTATVTVTVDPSGAVRGAQADLRVPASERAFRARGLKVTQSCESTGRARATLKVTSRVAKRLKLRSRTVAGRSVRCTTGRELSVRLRPKRSTARRLARTRTLRLRLSVSVKGAGVLQRRVTIR
jgi:PKD repeat protein